MQQNFVSGHHLQPEEHTELFDPTTARAAYAAKVHDTDRAVIDPALTWLETTWTALNTPRKNGAGVSLQGMYSTRAANLNHYPDKLTSVLQGAQQRRLL